MAALVIRKSKNKTVISSLPPCFPSSFLEVEWGSSVVRVFYPYKSLPACLLVQGTLSPCDRTCVL